MRTVITGADGFIGKNLQFQLSENGHANVVCLNHHSDSGEIGAALAEADCVFHLAGVNRPKDDAEFTSGNVDLTQSVCRELIAAKRRAMVVYSSSTQASRDNAYGRSKRAAEEALCRYSADTGAPVRLFRLSNVFGKWCRPNYNSAVATFCYNIARGLPVTIHAADAPLRLLYIDDVVEAFIDCLRDTESGARYVAVEPIYETSVGELVELLQAFAASRHSQSLPAVGAGLTRALYATYVSYLPPEAFSYELRRNTDPRGTFVEFLKTSSCGQMSYFTAHPGVTRGEHYHHSKTEKFLVIQGVARFGFRNMSTGEKWDMLVDGAEARVVETVPGWAHNITNVGDRELIVMLWANENFDPGRPDTIAATVMP